MAGDQDTARRAYEDMVRRLAELDRADGIDLSPPRQRRRQRRGGRRGGASNVLGPRDWRPADPRTRVRAGTTGTLVVALLIVAALVSATGGWRDAFDFSGPVSGPVARQTGWPPPPEDAQGSRLLPPVSVSATGSHAFQELRADGRPATYDPCRPLHYVINPAGMPGPGLQLVREAAAAISAATGLVLQEDGVTDEPLATDRSPLQEDRYGHRWAPVLIGWSTAAEYPLLSGDIAGIGGSHVLAPDGPGSERLVSGEVALDAEAFAQMLAAPGGHEHARAVVMHELAHVVGLAHVADAGELMDADNSGRTTWGPGDLEGLALVGAGDCHTDT